MDGGFLLEPVGPGAPLIGSGYEVSAGRQNAGAVNLPRRDADHP